jgi:hypothetical protein
MSITRGSRKSGRWEFERGRIELHFESLDLSIYWIDITGLDVVQVKQSLR